MNNSIIFDCDFAPCISKYRLFCFPHAGGGSYFYSGWRKKLPRNVDLFSIKLPGRGARLKDPPHQAMEGIIGELINHILPLLEIPAVFFGHSMGSLVAFELCRQLKKINIAPMKLCVSACRAPQFIQDNEKISHLSDEELISEIRENNGTPKEILEDASLLSLIIPILRTDFKIMEDYQFDKIDVLDCPITVFEGRSDSSIASDQLRAWSQYTRGTFAHHAFPGDHFFLKDQEDEIISAIFHDIHA